MALIDVVYVAIVAGVIGYLAMEYAKMKGQLSFWETMSLKKDDTPVEVDTITEEWNVKALLKIFKTNGRKTPLDAKDAWG